MTIQRKYDVPTQVRAFYGQDAQHAGPQPAFQDNGDGTVTDFNTGLMWQQKRTIGKTYWSSACDYCDELSLADHSDWRLPTRSELISIVDYGYQSSLPAIDQKYFPGISDRYWSSSGFTYDLGDAWYVDFSTGKVGHSCKGMQFSSCFCYVLCVRGGY